MRTMQATQSWTTPPVRSRSKLVSFRVSIDELATLEAEANRRKVSLSGLLRQALESLLPKGGA